MKTIKPPSSISNIPKYNSPRVTVEFDYDQRDARHLTHTCFLSIDGVKVCSCDWYEDDDWASASQERPNTKDMWEIWLNETH